MHEKRRNLHTFGDTIQNPPCKPNHYPAPRVSIKIKEVMVILPRMKREGTSFSKLIQSLLVAHAARIK